MSEKTISHKQFYCKVDQNRLKNKKINNKNNVFILTCYCRHFDYIMKSMSFYKVAYNIYFGIKHTISCLNDHLMLYWAYTSNLSIENSDLIYLFDF